MPPYLRKRLVAMGTVLLWALSVATCHSNISQDSTRASSLVAAMSNPITKVKKSQFKTPVLRFPQDHFSPKPWGATSCEYFLKPPIFQCPAKIEEDCFSGLRGGERFPEEFESRSGR